MQPTDLKAIARDAALRGDTKTLFHTLDLLERCCQSPPSWTFAPNLRNSACRGRVSTNKSEARPPPHAESPGHELPLGNPVGSLEASRRSFNLNFRLALTADFKKHGASAIEIEREPIT